MAAHLVVVHGEGTGGEQPVRPRQLARGHGAIEDDVVLGAGLTDLSAGEEEGIAVGVDEPGTLGGLDADRTGDIVEGADLGLEIDVAVAGVDFFLVFAAACVKVACSGELAGVVVVLDVIGFDEAIAVVQNDVAVEGVDAAGLSLRVAVDRDGAAGTRAGDEVSDGKIGAGGELRGRRIRSGLFGGREGCLRGHLPGRRRQRGEAGQHGRYQEGA